MLQGEFWVNVINCDGILHGNSSNEIVSDASSCREREGEKL